MLLLVTLLLSCIDCIVPGKMAVYTSHWQSDVSPFPCYRLSVTPSWVIGSQARQVPYLTERGYYEVGKPSISLSYLYVFCYLLRFNDAIKKTFLLPVETLCEARFQVVLPSVLITLLTCYSFVSHWLVISNFRKSAVIDSSDIEIR